MAPRTLGGNTVRHVARRWSSARRVSGSCARRYVSMKMLSAYCVKIVVYGSRTFLTIESMR